VNFTGAGTASGTYPGPFSETNGVVRSQGNYGPFGEGPFSVNFAITSGTTTIAGKITRNPLFSGMIGCGSGAGISFGGGTSNGQIGTYNATISTPTGHQTITNGSVNVYSGRMSSTVGSQGSLLAILTLP
jgi:hypothetical protein